MESYLPPEVQAEAEKSQARGKIKENLSGLINRKLEGSMDEKDEKEVHLEGAEADAIRKEVSRIKTMQEVWNKMDRGEALTTEDKEATKEVVEAWQGEIAAELQKAFTERKEIDLNRLADLEKEYQKKGDEFQTKNATEIPGGYRMDKETLALLRDLTSMQTEIAAMRRKWDESDAAIEKSRNALEASQELLDSIDTA